MSLIINGPLTNIPPESFTNISISVSSGNYPKPSDGTNGPDISGYVYSSDDGLIYNVYTFTIPGVTYTVNYTCNTTKPIYLLAVGGGGGGGVGGSGGAGAGGMIDQSFNLPNGTNTITINVGDGGAIRTSYGIGNPGTDTTFRFNVTGTQIIAGGGCGGCAVSAPTYTKYGSGGGGGAQSGNSPYTNSNTNQSVPGYSITIYANPGGSGTAQPGGPAGGGGGAGSAGVSGYPNTGQGGSGRQCQSYGIKDFNMTSVPYGIYNNYWAGGGGGGNSGSGVPGGSGIGGKSTSSGTSGSGVANTGSGGGGTWNNPGGKGGSGIVIIAFPMNG